MKKCIDGIMVDMTQEEIDALVKEPLDATPEERIAALEEALDLLLSGETGGKA